jgi:ribosomal-protein-alanine N-acetyltransferase
MISGQVHLREAAASDLGAILNLERATEFAPHWPEATYAAMLGSPAPQPAQPKRYLILAEYPDQTLAGFAVGLLHPSGAPIGPGTPGTPGSSGRTAELESVVVAASARRTGIGRALCHTVLDWSRSHGAAEVVLEVRASSAPAIALYAGLGFTQVGRRPRYYREPEDDALLMRLLLH